MKNKQFSISKQTINIWALAFHLFNSQIECYTLMHDPIAVSDAYVPVLVDDGYLVEMNTDAGYLHPSK